VGDVWGNGPAALLLLAGCRLAMGQAFTLRMVRAAERWSRVWESAGSAVAVTVASRIVLPRMASVERGEARGGTGS